MLLCADSSTARQLLSDTTQNFRPVLLKPWEITALSCSYKLDLTTTLTQHTLSFDH